MALGKTRNMNVVPMNPLSSLSVYWKTMGKSLLVLSSAFFCGATYLIGFPQFLILLESPALGSVPRFHVRNCWWLLARAGLGPT